MNETETILYTCIRCGGTMTAYEIEQRAAMKCVFCNYKILQKIKPPIVRKMTTK